MVEGEGMIKMVMGFPSAGMLMYVSDNPHAECEFPSSPARVKGWQSNPPQSMKMLMWDNAAKFFNRS